MDRNQGTASIQLSFAENILQNRNVEVDVGHPKQAPGLGADMTLHLLQNSGGIILLPFLMKAGQGVQGNRKNIARDIEPLRDLPLQSLQQPRIDVADRQQVDEPHRTSTGARVQPYFLSL